MAVIGGKSKKRYKKTVGDNGRTYTDDDGNSYNDQQFKDKEGDYTEETESQGKYVNTGGVLSGAKMEYQADKYSNSPKPSPSGSLGDLAKRIGMKATPEPTEEPGAPKKKKKTLEGMP